MKLSFSKDYLVDDPPFLLALPSAKLPITCFDDDDDNNNNNNNNNNFIS